MLFRVIRFFGLSATALIISFVGVLGIIFGARDHAQIFVIGWVAGFAVMLHLIFKRHWPQGRAAAVGVLGCGFLGEALQRGGAGAVGAFLFAAFMLAVVIWWMRSNGRAAKDYVRGSNEQRGEGR